MPVTSASEYLQCHHSVEHELGPLAALRTVSPTSAASRLATAASIVLAWELVGSPNLLPG